MFDRGNLSADHFIAMKQYLHTTQLIRNSIRFSSDLQQSQYDLLDLSIEYLRRILKSKWIDPIVLKDFCQRAQKYFSINVDLPARAQLNILHSKIEPWYRLRFSDTERRSLKIVIIGPKTVRHGHLEKICFYELLREHHEGRHIIYAESVDDEQQALQILGTWLLDAQAGRNFFDDKERLHRDLLSDAAQTYIQQLFTT